MEKKRIWLTPGQIAKRLGTTPHTVRSWIHVGVAVVGTDIRVKLKAISTGRYKVRKRWLAKFLADIEAVDNGRPVPPRPEPVSKQQARMQREKEELAAKLRKVPRGKT